LVPTDVLGTGKKRGTGFSPPLGKSRGKEERASK